MSVLDASAVLAVLFREAGMDAVIPHMRDGLLSTVNLAEVLEVFVRKDHARHDAVSALADTGMIIVPFSAHHAWLASELLEHARPLGLSFADCACLALALEQEQNVLTGDRLWASLDLGVPVTLIR
jgi:ribonuclease VapC